MLKKAEVILLIITFFWGLTFPIMKISISSFPPVLFLSYRFGIASFLMLLLFYKRISSKEILPGMLLGASLFAGHAFQIIGLKYTTASNSAFITSLYIVFTPILAYFLLKEPVKKHHITSVFLALLGIYLISNTNSLKIAKGDFLTLLCAISFALQIVLVQKFQKYSQKYSYISLSFWQLFFNFVFCSVYAFIFEKIVIPDNLNSLIGILYTSIFATVIAFTLQLKYQKFTTSSKAAIIYSAEPIFAHFSAMLLLGETLSMQAYLGALLIFLAILKT